jgi:hypothetical protein
MNALIQSTRYRGCCQTLIQSNQTATKLSGETEDEWSREGCVRDWKPLIDRKREKKKRKEKYR